MPDFINILMHYLIYNNNLIFFFFRNQTILLAINKILSHLTEVKKIFSNRLTTKRTGQWHTIQTLFRIIVLFWFVVNWYERNVMKEKTQKKRCLCQRMYEK